MTTTDEVKEQYNKFEKFPSLSYNCINYLVDNNDMIWKLLSYTDKDAYKNDSTHPNLTKAQKGALIYKGDSANERNFRVFMDFGQDIAWTEQVTVLRITPTKLIPKSYVYGNVSMALEVYTHYLINQLSNYQTRLNMITQQLIETLNGQEIGGLGRLYFDYRANSECRMIIGGQTPFKGNVLVMCNWIT
jgi:hypothetical protein